MFKFFKETPGAFLAAVLVHLCLLAILMFSLDWTPSADSQSSAKPAPVQAVVVDAEKLTQEVKRQENLKQQEREKEQKRLKELEEKAEKAKQVREREEKRLKEIKMKQEQEKKRIAEEKLKAEQDSKRRLEEKRRREAELKLAQEKKKEEEAKKRAEEKKKAEAAAKEKEEKRKAEQEAKRKAEEERLAEEKRKAEAEAKRKAEEKRKEEERKVKEEQARRKAEADRKAKEAAERAAAEKALQDSLLAEERQTFIGQEINRYAAKIKREVERVWTRPQDSGSGLSCIVQVKLLPSGKVVDVTVVQGSGNIAFDRSVEAAVYKAEPLSVPSDPDVMQAFRTFNFKFEPR